MKRIVIVAIAAASLGLLPDAAHAQLRLGVAGGPVTPVGSFGDAVSAGLHGGLVLEVGVPLFPVSLRADLMAQRFPGAGAAANLNEVFATANGRFGLLPIPLVSAYLTAGAGLYSSTYDPDPAISASRTTDLGLNAGVGGSINLIVVRPFVEVRYHHVLADNARGFIPVTVGLYF
jgi:hypothetical protein